MTRRSGVRKTVAVLLLLIGLVVYLTVVRLLPEQPDSQPPDLQQLGVIVFPEPQPIETFSLVDHDGKRVGKPDLRGQWTLAFLSYSGCEGDSCSRLLQTLAAFAETAVSTTNTQPELWFITVDPEQDDPATLKEHIQPLAVEVRGITGKRTQLKALARSLKGAFSLTPRDGAGKARIEYSSHFGLIGPNAQLLAIAQQPIDSRDLAEAYRQLVAWHGG